MKSSGKVEHLSPDELKIDPELSEWIVPLTHDEKERLEASIRKEGCRDPVIIDSEGFIIDGHNRHNACKKYGLKIPVITKEFESKESVKNWMIENQLARRNVTPEQRNYLIGKLYNEKKKEHGGTGANQHTVEQSRHNDDSAKTSEKIAQDFNVGQRTVERAGKFAESVDTIGKEFGEEEKQKILSREIKTTQKEVINMAKKINTGLFTSDTPEWYTPEDIISSVIEVFGEIDLDPCSNSHDKPNVPALKHYTIDDDGLAQKWEGKIYMNPPYGREIVSWVEKLVDEYKNGNVTEAIVLVPSRTDTAWFQKLNGYVWCAVRGRLKFSQAENSAPFPSAIFYLGENISSFYQSFSGLGTIFREMFYEEGDVW